MLRPGDGAAQAVLTVEEVFDRFSEESLPFLKTVPLSADVEVALPLLRLSLAEARAHDRASLPPWEVWLREKLAGHAELESLLVLLGP